MCRALWPVALLSFLALQAPFHCAYASGAGNVPIESRIYPFLEQLASWGLIEDALMGTRPLTRSEVSRLALEAAQGLERMKYEGNPAPAKMVRVVDELQAELLWTLAPGESSYFKPIGMPEIRLVYQDGKKSFIPGIQALQHGLVYNNEGIAPEQGFNGYLRFDVEGGIGPLSAFVQPLLSVNEDTKGTLQKGYLRLSAPNLDLEAGRISLWWGNLSVGYGAGNADFRARRDNRARVGSQHPNRVQASKAGRTTQKLRGHHQNENPPGIHPSYHSPARTQEDLRVVQLVAPPRAGGSRGESYKWKRVTQRVAREKSIIMGGDE